LFGPNNSFPNNFGKSNLVRCLHFYHDLSNSEVGSYSQYVQELKHQHGLYDNLTITVTYEYANTNQSKYPLEIGHSISYDKNGKFERERIYFTRIEMDEMDAILAL
jgi:hypothetical protein